MYVDVCVCVCCVNECNRKIKSGVSTCQKNALTLCFIRILPIF